MLLSCHVSVFITCTDENFNERDAICFSSLQEYNDRILVGVDCGGGS